MQKNYLFDVDGLLQVLQAIKEGKPVEYRPLEEPNWRDFDPEDCDIDTENCKYRVKPCEYGENIGTVVLRPEDLQEDRIYFLTHGDYNTKNKDFICVKSNLWRENKMVTFHFSWQSDGVCATLLVGDVNAEGRHSEQSKGFANIIAPHIVSNNFDGVEIRLASLAQVEILESKLREIGYEFENGEIKKIDGSKE
jgi:hypothetical protein